MKRMRLLLILLLACFAFSAPARLSAGNNLTAAEPLISEDFNSMWDASASEATLALPANWRIDRNLTAPRTLSSWADASDVVMYTGGTSLPSNAKNGTWNFGNSADATDRAVGGMTTTVSNGTRGINLMTALHNADDALIINWLNVDYAIEKYRKGANAAGFTVQLYYSTDGVKWTNAGDDFKTAFDPDNETLGAEVVPLSTTNVSDKKLRVHVEPGKDLYLAWNISVSSGTTPDKAPALSIDDVKLTATFTDKDDEWVEPDEPVKNPSGIYLRGEVNGWGAVEEWEFDKTGEGTYRLVDKNLSGAFKIADASWSSACNHGSNGSSIAMDEPYATVSGTNDNITCGGNTYECTQILLTIVDGVATITLESDTSTDGLTSVYVVGDFNGWDYMDKSGELKLDTATGTFSGRLTMKASNEGLSYWRIYQRLGMSGSWGLAANATESSLSGTLLKGEKGNVATSPGTYDIEFNITSGNYQLTAVSSVPAEMTLEPASTILVPTLPEKVRVLSLNNSLIHYNDQCSVFNAIADAMGTDAEWTTHTLLGKSLATHWEEGDGLASDGLPGAKMMVRSQPWSHIILQEQSSLPRTNVETFRANVGRWVEYIRANCPNPNAIIILPVNWAYSGDWDNFTTYNNKFIANYIDVANEYGLTICPVASAYQAVYDKDGVDAIAAWYQDDRHPTDMSTYMAACMEYGLIFGINPMTISYTPTAVESNDASSMRYYAFNALSNWKNTVDHTGGKVRFAVSVTDDFGVELDPGELTFTIDNGGEINADNEFVTTATGTYNVTVSNGIFTRTAVVTVAEAVTKMPVIPSIKLDTENLSYEQNFNALGNATNAIMPEGWRIDRQTSGPRTVGSFHSADDATMYSGGVSLPSNAKNGTWNFGDNVGDDRAVGGITTGVANGSRAINVYAHFLNSGKKNLENVTLSYNIEKYRNGNNSAGFTVALYYSADGNTWTSAGDDFVTKFEPSSATAGFETVPGETVSVSATLPQRLDGGCDLYLAWNISATSGDNCAGAPALAIDDVKIVAVPQESPTFDYYIYVEDLTGYEAMGVYAYGDKEIWGAWPGQAPIDEKTIEGCTYKVFGHNESTGAYSLIINNWNRSKQLPDFAIVGGRDYYLLATGTSVSEKELNSISNVAANQELTIVFDGESIRAAGAATITAYSTAGSVIAVSTSDSLSLSSLTQGLYIIEAKNALTRNVKRILKR